MTQTLRDTAFGKLVRLATHKRYFQYPEEKDPDICRYYLRPEKEVIDEQLKAEEENPESFGLFTVLSQASRVTSRAASRFDGEHRDTAEDKNGATIETKRFVVDWRDAHDSEVSLITACMLTCLLELEPSELVHDQEILGEHIDMDLDVFDLYRLRYIFSWHPWGLGGISCLSSSSNVGIDLVRTWLWSW